MDRHAQPDQLHRGQPPSRLIPGLPGEGPGEVPMRTPRSPSRGRTRPRPASTESSSTGASSRPPISETEAGGRSPAGPGSLTVTRRSRPEQSLSYWIADRRAESGRQPVRCAELAQVDGTPATEARPAVHPAVGVLSRQLSVCMGIQHQLRDRRMVLCLYRWCGFLRHHHQRR